MSLGDLSSQGLDSTQQLALGAGRASNGRTRGLEILLERLDGGLLTHERLTDRVDVTLDETKSTERTDLTPHDRDRSGHAGGGERHEDRQQHTRSLRHDMERGLITGDHDHERAGRLPPAKRQEGPGHRGRHDERRERCPR